MPYPYALDDYANEVIEKVEKSGLKKPSVIAHSFGARIAVKIASQNPDFFDKIVLVGAAGLKPKSSLKKSIKKTTFRFLRLFAKKEKLKRFYSKDYLALSPIMQESFIKIVNEHLDGLARKVENQTLVIVGDKDKETPIYMAKKYAKSVKNGTLSVFRGAGHFAFIDMPEKFNREVSEFLLR